ncbi:MAG: hypothetical protein J6N52_09885 [Clostridia bacterium]|nr:hypothetical protein [Clostridia bacterium]
MNKVVKKMSAIMALVVSIFSWPVVSAESVSDAVIADFTKEETYSRVSNTARLSYTSMAKLSSDKCGKYILNGGGTGVEYSIPEASRDFSKYDTFSFWAYNDGYNDVLTDADKQFIIVLKNASSTWRGNIAYKEIKLDWHGWKKFNIKLSDFAVNGTFNWSDVNSINLRPDVLNAVGVSDYWDEVYFDKMWISNTQPGTVLLDLASDEDYNKYKVISTTTNAFVKDTSLSYYNDNAGLLNVPIGKYAVIYNDTSNLIDISGSKYINMAIYSDKNTKPDNSVTDFTRIKYYFYSTDGGWYQTSIDLSWEGWKLVSVPVQAVVIGGTSTTVQFKDCKTIKGFRIIIEKNPQNAKAYFDRIYLAKDAPAALEAKGFSIADGEENVTGDRKTVSLSFNNKLSPYVNKSNVVITKNSEIISEDYHVGTFDNELKIYFDKLDLNSEYNISVNNVVDIYSQSMTFAADVTFKTINKAFEAVDDVYFSSSQGGERINSLNDAENVFVNCKIKNNTGYSEIIRMYIASYDETGRIVSVNIADKMIFPGKTEEVKDLSVNVGSGNAVKVKAFAWNLKMVPVFDFMSSIGSAG